MHEFIVIPITPFWLFLILGGVIAFCQLAVFLETRKIYKEQLSMLLKNCEVRYALERLIVSDDKADPWCSREPSLVKFRNLTKEEVKLLFSLTSFQKWNDVTGWESASVEDVPYFLIYHETSFLAQYIEREEFHVNYKYANRADELELYFDGSKSYWYRHTPFTSEFIDQKDFYENWVTKKFEVSETNHFFPIKGLDNNSVV